MKIPSLAAAKQKFLDESFVQGAKYGFTGIFAFLASNVKLLGSLSPFGIALSMALPAQFSVASILGALAGYSLFGNFAENLPYLIALLAVMGLKFAIAGIPRLRGNPAVLCTASAAMLAVCLIIRNALFDKGTIDLIFCLCESVLGGALTYFAFHASKIVLGRKKIAEGGLIERASLAVVVLVGLLGTCQIEFFVFNLGRILAALSLLIISNRRGATAGAVCGLATAAVLALYSPEFAISGGIFALAAMMSGYFAIFGKLTQTAFFILIHTIGILIVGADTAAITSAFDLLLASALFMAMPQKLLQKIPAPVDANHSKTMQETGRTSMKLRFASKTLDDMQQAVEAVSEKLRETGVNDISAVYDRTVDQVCRRCGLKMFCWETTYSQTMDAFLKFTPILKENGKVTKEDLAAHFTTQCAKSEEILRTVNSYYHEYLSKGNAARKVLEAKQVATEQFEGIADMLEEMSEEISEVTLLNPKLTQKARDILIEAGERPEEVYCILDQYDRMRVEIYQQNPLKVDARIITEQLSEALDRQFDFPSVVTVDDMTKISFFEQAQYTLQFGVSQLNSGNNKVSGDCYEYFTDSRGFAHLILSDGMGNGGRAAIDSIMTCNFVLKLLKAGFGFDAALKLINSALLVKAGDESLATLDIGCIDLYTGNAEFLKAGAACSFIARNGKTVMVDGSSLPMGILQGISYDKRQIKLQDGDLIVMVTDGAISITPEWLQEEINMLSGSPPREIATKLASLARHRGDVPGDDITVLAARMVRVN